MRTRTMPGSAARLLVPFTIAATIAAGFALYAWGGIGPAEQELVAAAATRFGALQQTHAGTTSLSCDRLASTPGYDPLPGLPRLQAAAIVRRRS